MVGAAGGSLRVRRLGVDRAGEIRLTRFLRNPRVTPEEMVATAAAATAERAGTAGELLAIQDTTVVRSAGGGGLYLHAVMLCGAGDGALLGLAHAAFLSRAGGKARTRRARPVAEKESARWLDGAEAAARVAGGRAVTLLADREADIYAAFARRPAGVSLVIRAAHDRALEEGGRLFAELDAQPVAGRAALAIPAGPGRAARETTVAARFLAARLRRPRNGRSEGLPEALGLTLVDIRETDPPAGTAPLHWRLVTTRTVEDADAAFAVADLYRRRWAIEQLFRTLKTGGFDIEGIGIAAETPLRNLVMAALIAAVSVQQLVHARDGAPQGQPLRPLTDAFEPQDEPILQALTAELEGRTARQKNPHPPGSLAYGAWVCARLGGWNCYYGKPGPAVMYQGWKHFQAIKHGANLRLLGHV